MNADSDGLRRPVPGAPEARSMKVVTSTTGSPARQLSFLTPDCGLCLRWTDRRHSWRHRSEGGFDRTRYEVAPILDDATARAYCERNHYTASYPAARLRYGLYERGGALAGVAVLAVPARAAVLTAVFPHLVPYRESLELGRLVLADRVPANAESWMLARVWELAAREGVRGVVSFSDPLPRRRADGTVVTPGHVGICYQAANAVYLGRATPRTLTLLPDGTVFSDRARQKVRAGERGHRYAERVLERRGASPLRPDESPAAWLARALVTVGARTVRHRGNHRYAFTLDRRATVVPVAALPGLAAYPKRPDAAPW